MRPILLLLIFTLTACATAPIPDTRVAGTSRLLLINSNAGIARYQVAESAFLQSFTDRDVQVLNLAGEQSPVGTVQDSLNKQAYDLIYCIGVKALGSIDQVSVPVPVVYSSVLSWHYFQARDGYYGVASSVPVGVQLGIYKLFFAGAKRIGILYSDANASLMKQAQEEARKLGLIVVAEHVDGSQDVLLKLQEMLGRVDAMWLISDPAVIASKQQAGDYFNIAHAAEKPVFASNRLFHGMGAALTISADLPTVGRQAAVMAEQLLSGDTVSSVVPPVGSYITLNLHRSKSYGLTVNEKALDIVNELIDESSH